jgi:hypothetical protein
MLAAGIPTCSCCSFEMVGGRQYKVVRGSLSCVSVVQSHTPAGTSHKSLQLDASKVRRHGSWDSTADTSSTPMQQLMCSADRCCSGQGGSADVLLLLLLLLLAAGLGASGVHRTSFWPTSSMGR